MSYFVVLPIIVVLNFILQTTLLTHFSIMGIIPNTALILVVCFSLLGGKKIGGILGLVIGLLHDIILYDVIGIHGLIYFIIGYGLGILSNNLFKENYLTLILFTGVSTISFHAMFYIIAYFLGLEISFRYILGNIVLIETIYNSVIAIFIFRCLTKLFNNSPSTIFASQKRR